MRIGLIKMRVYNKERNPVAEPPKKKFEAMDKAKVVFDDDNPEWTAEDLEARQVWRRHAGLYQESVSAQTFAGETLGTVVGFKLSCRLRRTPKASPQSVKAASSSPLLT